MIQSFLSIRHLGRFSLLAAFCAILIEAPCIAQPSDFTSYDPMSWKVPVGRTSCANGALPDTGVFNSVTVFGDMPGLGYPLHYALIAGINDTLQVAVYLSSRSDSDYPLPAGYQSWFMPEVYSINPEGPESRLVSDSTTLGFRFRGWFAGTTRMPSQPKIPARLNGSWYWVYDVWNLPVGHFEVCMVPIVPPSANFIGVGGGGTIDYQPARSLADSINGYERCFWRAANDSDFAATAFWVNKILAVNSKSVPGWWLSARRYEFVGDTVNAKKSFDNALLYLANRSDPIMPDSTKHPLTKIEREYVNYCDQSLRYYRGLYAP